MPSAFKADEPQAVAGHLLHRPCRLLLVGEAGSGKSTLATAFARWLDARRIDHRIVGADPGSPAFGIPGAVCVGRCKGGRIHLLAHEALCSLNAGRFRLPLIDAVRRLSVSLNHRVVIVDGPGLVRGIAAAELLVGLVDAAGIDTLLVIDREGKAPPLVDEILASRLPAYRVSASPHARLPNTRQRRNSRTALWDAYVAAMPVFTVAWERRPLLGTPPPKGDRKQWPGRQVAFVDGRRTLAMGEIVSAETDHLRVRLPASPPVGSALLVRDAGRIIGGGLGTRPPANRASIRPAGGPGSRFVSKPVTGTVPGFSLGLLTIELPNGIFGDPLLHLRLPNQRRSLLFDLGEGSRLPARLAHQISDVFITHAHIDHIGGFLWLLRSRIGELPTCRIYGPPGLSRHIGGTIDGICWDRIGHRGPRFEISELHGDRLRGVDLQVGGERREGEAGRPIEDGRVIDDPGFSIRATAVDHGIPVLALAYEEKPHCHIRKQALENSGYPPGPWLGTLKKLAAAGRRDASILLPDGQRLSVDRLAERLVRVTAGRKLAYATDVADTPANRERLTELARGADLFFCEAAFTDDHRHLANGNGHLTARACGEIAAAAGVKHLIPLHLSRRYERHPERVYAEIRQACNDEVTILAW